MSIQWMDSFDSYGLNGPGQTFMSQGTPYTILNSTPIPDIVNSAKVCLAVGGTVANRNTADNNVALPVPNNAIGCAMRWYCNSLPGSYGGKPDLMSWRDASNDQLIALTQEVNGALTFYNCGYLGVNYTQIASTVVPVTTAASWYHIEAYVDYNLGVVKAYVEGILVLSGTFTSAPSTLIYNFGWSGRQNDNAPYGNFYLKDLIIYDSIGTTNHTAGCIGPCTVYRLNLTTDVSNGWTVTGGTTVSGTIGAEPPVDTKYISAGYGPFPAAAIAHVSSLPTTVVAVRGVMPLTRIEKSDGGVASYQADLISTGGVAHTGTTKQPTNSFQYNWDVCELDPATGAAWTPIAVNNVQVKLDRTV